MRPTIKVTQIIFLGIMFMLWYLFKYHTIYIFHMMLSLCFLSFNRLNKAEPHVPFTLPFISLPIEDGLREATMASKIQAFQ